MASFLSNLGLAVLLPQDELLRLIRSAPHRYKVFKIPKRKEGEFRTIAQPAKEVKALQYWVMRHVLNQFDVHPAATAYQKGLSIADNARPHTRGRYLLKLDFSDFFPSIKAKDLDLFLSKHTRRFNAAEIEPLCRILFWMPRGSRKLQLSIGAPTSPLLSNILLGDFDSQVAAACARERVAYTRYADDLSFSARSSKALAQIEALVIETCARQTSPVLRINEAKTARVSKKESRRVTGLVLTNDGKVSIGRELKRKIRAQMHGFATDRLDSEQCLELRGMLAYINSVEPRFITRLQRKYGADVVRRCQEWSRE